MNRDLLTPEELEALLSKDAQDGEESGGAPASPVHEAGNEAREEWRKAEQRLLDFIRSLTDTVASLTERVRDLEREISALKASSAVPGAASATEPQPTAALEAAEIPPEPAPPLPEPIRTSRSERHKSARKSWFN